MLEELLDQIWDQLATFYNNNQQLATGGLAGAILTIILTKLLPSIASNFSKAITRIGKYIGGRFSFKSIQDSYLNWVVLQNQDLNLTGIIGSVEKPKLEQIFISLSVSKDHGDFSDTFQTFSQSISYPILVARAILGHQINKIREYIHKIRNTLISKSGEESEFFLFKPRRLWRIRQIWNRDGFSFVTGSIFAFIICILLPLDGLFLLPDINNVFAGFGLFTWMFLLAIFLDDFQKQSIKRRFLNISLVIIVISIVFYNVYYKIIINNQSPFALISGTILASAVLLGIYFSERGSGYISIDDVSAKGVGKLLSSYNNIAILGKPGAGKSTYIQFIALTFAQEKAGDSRLRKKNVIRERFGKYP